MTALGVSGVYRALTQNLCQLPALLAPNPGPEGASYKLIMELNSRFPCLIYGGCLQLLLSQMLLFTDRCCKASYLRSIILKQPPSIAYPRIKEKKRYVVF